MSSMMRRLSLLLFAAALAVPSAAQSPAPAAPVSSANSAPSDYQVGPEDILKVTVYGHEDLTQTVVVQGDGSFMFPLLGSLRADGMTPRELEKKISTLLAQGFIRNPQVTVVVQEYRSKTIFVVGEVLRPGTYPLASARTLVEILAKAGPTTSNAGTEAVVVRPRNGSSGPILPGEVGETGRSAEVIRVDLREIQAGALDKNVPLKPGDTVFIPQAAKVFIEGQVRNPGGYAFSPGLTVRQMISLAGGFTDLASEGRIRVHRVVDGEPQELKVEMDDPVKPGDSIEVKKKLF